MPNRCVDQIAYVTNDIEKAIRHLSERYGVEGFDVQRIVLPARAANTTAVIDISVGKAYVEGFMLEVIQAHADVGGFFNGSLPSDGSFALRFHHSGIRLLGEESDWNQLWDEFNRAQRIYFTCDLGKMSQDVKFFFADERATLGHFVEYAWLRDPTAFYSGTRGLR